MKTRILYPKNIWYSKQFRSLSIMARLLCIYLISNENVGLTKIYKQHDLEACFILGINESELEKCKKEIQKTGLFYFKDEWVFINNDFSYCDYVGGKEVMASKGKELSSIPAEIKDFFDRLLTGGGRVNDLSKTGQRLYINHKPKTINHKSGEMQEGEKKKPLRKQLRFLRELPDEVVKDFSERFEATEKQIKSKAEDLLNYCQSHGKTYKNYRSFLLNACKKDFQEREIPIEPAPALPEVKERDIKANARAIEEMREKLKNKIFK